MTVWFTSDPHWGHEWVAGLRGFNSAQEHDAALLEIFQATIKPGDQVWWLGDLAMGNPTYALNQTALIPGHHHLITGNHDPVNPMHRDAHKYQKTYLEVFESVQAFARRRIPNAAGEGYYEALLSHYPYLGGDPAESDHSLEPRHTQYRLPDEGKWLIHGHTHHPDQRVHGHQIHVGLDAWNMKPVPLELLSELIFQSTQLPAYREEISKERTSLRETAARLGIQTAGTDIDILTGRRFDANE